MNRLSWIKIHLYLSAFFAPFIILMAITGTSYLMDYKGDEKKDFVKEVSYEELKDFSEENVKSVLLKIDPDYSFEYLKSGGNTVSTRPFTRAYYSFEKKNDIVALYKHSPNFLRAMIEIHKGHGPIALKWFQKFLGIGLFLITLSGMWLGFSLARDKTATLVLSSMGFVVLAILYLFL
ncbi:MAG: hypothetical protein Fur0010_13920 [Bdellovibrio sp.]